MSFVANPFLANPAATIRRVEENIRYLLISAWARRQAAGLWWRRVVGTKTATNKRELMQWMLETARIHPLGNGGRMGFDDVAEWNHFIENEAFGDGFRLTEEMLLDASGKAIDRAGQWARQIGDAGAYWPQEQAAYLLRRGKVLTCYDKKPFFAEDHPVNPYENDVIFTNLIKGFPFTPENLSEIYAYVERIPAPDGKPRKLKPRIVAGGSDLRLPVVTALGAETISDPLDPGTGSSVTNMIKTSYGFVEPILDADFSEPGVWYLFCELLAEDAELAPLIYQEWAPYVLNSYASTSDAQLSTMDEWQWHFKGRNGIGYGHPFLAFRIESTGTETDLDAILAQFPVHDPTA
jgi:hypothetical protein